MPAELVGQYLDGNFALEPGIEGAIHLAHPAFAEKICDLVRAESCPNCDRHEVVRIIRNSDNVTNFRSCIERPLKLRNRTAGECYTSGSQQGRRSQKNNCRFKFS